MKNEIMVFEKANITRTKLFRSLPDIQHKSSDHLVRLIRGSGRVYILHDENRKLCKIGFSKDVDNRISNIITSGGLTSGDYVTTTTLIEPRKIERNLHTLFTSCRVSGEWFNVTLDKAVEALRHEINTVEVIDDETLSSIIRDQEENSKQFTHNLKAFLGGSHPLVPTLNIIKGNVMSESLSTVKRLELANPTNITSFFDTHEILLCCVGTSVYINCADIFKIYPVAMLKVLEDTLENSSLEYCFVMCNYEYINGKLLIAYDFLLSLAFSDRLCKYFNKRFSHWLLNKAGDLADYL